MTERQNDGRRRTAPRVTVLEPQPSGPKVTVGSKHRGLLNEYTITLVCHVWTQSGGVPFCDL